jgi:hypothetical protein
VVRRGAIAYSPAVIVVWNGTDLFKAYHDPDTGWLDLVSSRPAEGGEAWTMGEGFSIGVDEEGNFCHLGVDVGACTEGTFPTRPADAPMAVDAEVEVEQAHPPIWSFDAKHGRLSVIFRGVEFQQWGRMGDNLLWLALDEEGRLAALVFEGVSRDPGGRGQATWLSEVRG